MQGYTRLLITRITNHPPPMDNINLIILDWMIAERELFLKVNQKNAAVRNRDFGLAAKLLEEQRAIEERLPTMEQLQNMKKEITNG
jgi:hypothetical protein